MIEELLHTFTVRKTLFLEIKNMFEFIDKTNKLELGLLKDKKGKSLSSIQVKITDKLSLRSSFLNRSITMIYQEEKDEQELSIYGIGIRFANIATRLRENEANIQGLLAKFESMKETVDSEVKYKLIDKNMLIRDLESVNSDLEYQVEDLSSRLNVCVKARSQEKIVDSNIRFFKILAFLTILIVTNYLNFKFL